MRIKRISAEDTWQLRHEVLWPDMPFEFIKLAEDADGFHFGAYIENKLVSIISLFETDQGTVQFRKYATLKNEQGKGYGSKLLSHLIKFAQDKGFHTLWCNARADKTSFYKNFGMFNTQETYTKQNIKFVILKKVL